MSKESTYEFTRQLADSLQAGLTEEGIKRVKKQVEDIVHEALEDIEFRLESDAASNIAFQVQQLFRRAFEEMLKGNEAEFRRYIYAAGYTGRDDIPVNPVVNGELFEHGPIHLRHKLVEAYPELLRTERIADLEHQVERLVEQVNRLETRNRRLLEGIE